MIFIRGVRMNTKKKIMILVVVCLLVLAGAFIADFILGKNYFKEIKYDEIIEKLDNKEDVVLLISQTTCSHCASYKPKLEDVAKEYKINVYYIDIDLLDDDEYDELNSRLSFATSGTPLTIFLKDGEESTVANRIKGDSSRDKIIKKLKSNGFISE